MDTVTFYRIWMPVLSPLLFMHILLLLSGGVVVFVFLLLGGANIGYGDLLSYLDACVIPFVVYAHLAVVIWWGCGMCVF